MALLRLYGEATTLAIPIPKAGMTDFAASADWTPAAGDVKVSKDGGDVANIATLPTAIGGTGAVLWLFSLSATEMQAKHVAIQIVDAAVENQCVVIETFGHASAQYGFDLSQGLTAASIADAVLDEALLPHQAAGSAGEAMGKIVAVAAMADAICDEALAGHTSAGTVGKALGDVATAAAIASASADAVWDEAIAGHAAVGSTGEALADASVPVVVTPITTEASATRNTAPIALEMYQGAYRVFALTVLDANGDAVDLGALTLRMVVHDPEDPTTANFAVEDGVITRTGAGNEVANVPVDPTQSASVLRNYRWLLWDVTDEDQEQVLLHGLFNVLPAAQTAS